MHNNYSSHLTVSYLSCPIQLIIRVLHLVWPILLFTRLISLQHHLKSIKVHASPNPSHLRRSWCRNASPMECFSLCHSIHHWAEKEIFNFISSKSCRSIITSFRSDLLPVFRSVINDLSRGVNIIPSCWPPPAEEHFGEFFSSFRDNIHLPKSIFVLADVIFTLSERALLLLLGFSLLYVPLQKCSVFLRYLLKTKTVRKDHMRWQHS